MIKCVMCHLEFEEAALDFLGRCEPCFRKYLTMEDRPKLSIPFTPISKAVK